MTSAMFQDDATDNRFIPEIPLKRMGSVDDIAETVLYLADEKASGFVTGQLMDLSGGQHMGHLPNQNVPVDACLLTIRSLFINASVSKGQREER